MSLNESNPRQVYRQAIVWQRIGLVLQEAIEQKGGSLDDLQKIIRKKLLRDEVAHLILNGKSTSESNSSTILPAQATKIVELQPIPMRDLIAEFRRTHEGHAISDLTEYTLCQAPEITQPTRLEFHIFDVLQQTGGQRYGIDKVITMFEDAGFQEPPAQACFHLWKESQMPSTQILVPCPRIVTHHTAPVGAASWMFKVLPESAIYFVRCKNLRFNKHMSHILMCKTVSPTTKES